MVNFSITWVGSLTRIVLSALIDVGRPPQLWSSTGTLRWHSRLKRALQRVFSLLFIWLPFTTQLLALLLLLKISSLLAEPVLMSFPHGLETGSSLGTNHPWVQAGTTEASCLLNWVTTGCFPLVRDSYCDCWVTQLQGLNIRISASQMWVSYHYSKAYLVNIVLCTLREDE